MDDEPEVIRQRLDNARSAMADKIGRLEQAVNDKVQAVSDTVESVKETFDVRRYFREYPWAAFGASLAAGAVGGAILSGRRRPGDRIAELRSRGRPFTPAPQPSVNGGEQAPAAAIFAGSVPQAAPGWAESIASTLGDEVDKLKAMALGAAFGLVRDWVGRSAPDPIRDHLSGVIDDITRKLGGEPIRGNLLDSFSAMTNGGKASRERETCNEARAGRDRVAG